jgi:hypothetical protein
MANLWHMITETPDREELKARRDFRDQLDATARVPMTEIQLVAHTLEEQGWSLELFSVDESYRQSGAILTVFVPKDSTKPLEVSSNHGDIIVKRS